ncbi:MAG: PIG-L family deacetylase [Clostridia bacterium]|nr:PIG-L family deacetylase [Clostridia bacterium]
MRKKAFAAIVLILIFLLPSASAMVGEEFYCIWLDLEEFDPIIDTGEDFIMKGAIRSGGAIDRVEAVLYDLRLLKVEKTWSWSADKGKEISEIGLDRMRAKLMKGVSAGEKRLTITAEGRGRTFELLDHELYKCGYTEQIANISEKCTFSCSDRQKKILYDNGAKYRWVPEGAEDVLVITLPEGVTGEGFQVEWFRTPDSADIRFYDDDGALIRGDVYGQDDFMPVIAWFALPEGTRYFTLSVPGSEMEELLVFERGKTPSMVQIWEETPEKWDLMLVSAHQDDELLFFGGAIPWYNALGKTVGVVYMADCGHKRYEEALRGLWSCGLKNYPVFLNLPDKRLGSLEYAFTFWGGEDKITEMLAEQIRRYKPDVVLTHDFEGEYGHKQHMVTAYSVANAIEAAADPARYPDSAEKWGVWQAKKLYIHLWKEERTDLDWERDVPGFGGLTAMEIARRGYDKHRSQQRGVHFSWGYEYPNWIFGLYSTTVGPDTTGTDLFENIR